MGNANVGSLFNACGVTDVAGFQNTARAVINMHNIEPWPCRVMVKERLARQTELAKRSPLRNVPVAEGVKYFNKRVSGWFSSLKREDFVNQAIELLVQTKTRHGQQDRNELYDIFDSMDFDGNGELGVGEWAGGLSVFFKGNHEECIHAVFDTLDRNGDKSLSKSEMCEYLTPFVKAMTPPEADAIRPLLLKKATDEIYEEMDLDHNHQVSVEEFYAWSKQGNNIIDRLANIMEHEVYQIWLEEKDHQARVAYSKGYGGPNQGRQQNYGPGPYGQQNYGPGPYGQQNYGPGMGQYGQQPNQGPAMPKPHSFVTDDTHNSVYGGGYNSNRSPYAAGYMGY